jgi:hypothetical protein
MLGNWQWYRLWCLSAWWVQRMVTWGLHWTHGQNFVSLLMAEVVTPLVLHELKLGHGIICTGISLCMLHLECIH